MTISFNRVGDFTVGDRVTVSTSDKNGKRLPGVITEFFPLGYSGFEAKVELDCGGETRDFVHNLKKEITVRPIRPTVVEFETEEEYQDFIKYATSTEKTDSPELNRLRRELKAHTRTPMRKDKGEDKDE